LLISPVTRKVLKVSAYVLGSIVVLALAFHFWFINHAERMLEDLVSSRSNGKLKLHVKKFKFNWFSYDMQLRNAVFYSTDTSASTAYRFGVQRINVRVKEILPLIFEKKLLIDSLALIKPDIQVTRLKSLKSDDTTSHKEVSLSHEMGKVYNSIQDALAILQVNRFRIDDGQFVLINKTRDDQVPVSITNIYLHLDNLQVDSNAATGRKKILFSDNVAVNTYSQNILFPDGRHRLSFRHFHINILEKTVSFDSCTISAIKSDSTRSSFSVFFDKLQLTNIDFDTLYQKEVIKADSVYCINPQFKLDVELDKKKDKKVSPPRLDELIQQLTGDLNLAFVIVNNGSFDITTMREGRPSSFTSDHNNFEMQGLNIEKNSPRHVSVKSFAMGIRNYENFLRDSAFFMRFDSILFVNNSVFLSNFSFRQLEKDKTTNSFSMPQFEVRGLSWDDLIFEKSLTADLATLYHPVINYTVKKKKKQNIFQTLDEISRIIQLENLNIHNGEINVHFRDGVELRLENTDMSVLSQDLLQSKRMAGLQRSIRKISFKKGFIKTKNLIARIENASFAGEHGKLTAGLIHLDRKEKDLQIVAKNISIDSMMMDEHSNISAVHGIQWQEANLKIKGLKPGKNNGAGKFTMTGINGRNTTLSVSSNDQNFGVYLQNISADQIDIKPKSRPQIINLQTNGSNFTFTNSNSALSIGRFGLADHGSSEMENLRFKKNTSEDSISVNIPALSFEPDLNAIINQNIFADNIKLAKPTIQVKQSGTAVKEGKEQNKLPQIALGKLLIQQPELLLVHTGNNEARIEWHGQTGENNFIALSNFKIGNGPEPKIETGQLEFAITDLSVTAANKTFTTGNGSIRSKITGFYLEPSLSNEWNWKGVLSDLYVKDFILDNLGKRSGRLEIKSARLSELALNSGSFLHIQKTIKENPAFRLKEVSGQYDNTSNHFDWHNLNYDKTTKMLSLDSFAFRPTAERDSFIASHKYQSDHITLRTGRIDAGPFEIDRYFMDTVINTGMINMNDVAINVYRDKRKPTRGELVKPLPVNLIRKIPMPLSVDTAYLTNATIIYEEVNEKTNQKGTVPVDKIQGRIFPIVNYNIPAGDTLHLEMEGRLMDSVMIALNLKESYTDSLGGFLLLANVKPVDAKLLNPILMPLVSAKLESAFLDTLSMRVKGNEYVAIGQMQMFYHDLRIRILHQGEEKKRPFIKAFANFLANNFVIKKNNHSRTGDIYFERIRDKSTMNYLVKIMFSGIGSNVGLKKSKRLLRQYKKEKRKRNLPIIEYD